MSRKLGDKALQNKLERALVELLSGKSTKTAEEREEMRQNINAATKFLAVKHKLGGEAYGSGFSNGADKGGENDAGIDDDGSD